MKPDDSQRTIADFDGQWTRFTDSSGYYGSSKLFQDIIAPLLKPEEILGRRVAEIGSGTGRIVEMLLAAGASHVTAIEPSTGFNVLARRFATRTQRVSCRNITGEQLVDFGPFDLVLSIGVLHHIPKPLPVMRAAYQALRPGGRLFAWLYGREGNRLYLAAVNPLRALTSRIPDKAVHVLTRALEVPLVAYIWLCRFLPLPQRQYMLNVMGRLEPENRRLVIFDQLNPTYARYYSRHEALELFSAAGFIDIGLHHRHGYSWSIIGSKPKEA